MHARLWADILIGDNNALCQTQVSETILCNRGPGGKQIRAISELCQVSFYFYVLLGLIAMDT